MCFRDDMHTEVVNRCCWKRNWQHPVINLWSLGWTYGLSVCSISSNAETFVTNDSGACINRGIRKVAN